MPCNIKELREKRAKTVAEMRELNEKVIAEKRDFSAEEQQRWDTMSASVEADKRSIDREEKLQAEERHLKTAADKDIGSDPIESRKKADRKTDPEKRTSPRELQSQALIGWMRSKSGVRPSKQQRAAMAKLNYRGNSVEASLFRTEEYNSLRKEARTMSTTTGSQGGFTVPIDLVRAIEIAMILQMDLRQICGVMRTEAGNPLNMPTVDDTANKGEIVGQNATTNDQDVAFGQKAWGAYKFSSKLVKVPAELLEDSAVNLVAVLSDLLTKRLAAIQNEMFTKGTGVNQPTGYVTAATVGKTAALNNAITADEITDLIYSVGAPYRRNAVFVMNDTTIATLLKLKTSDGAYVWQPTVQQGQPDRLRGYAVYTNPEMDSIAASKKPIAFGDFSKYLIRDAGAIRTRRLVERFAENDQEGFVVFWRADGNLLDAGTHPIKVLATPA